MPIKFGVQAKRSVNVRCVGNFRLCVQCEGRGNYIRQQVKGKIS